jgi:SpoVK/Ycf46/Vps4 family AAA+-type ATPase
VFIDSYNEIVRCLLARVSGINVVTDSERFLDQMLPVGLCAAGVRQVSEDQLLGLSKLEQGSPVAVLDSNILTGMSLRNECVKRLKDVGALDDVMEFVKSCTDTRGGMTANKIPDALIVMKLQELCERTSVKATGTVLLLILRDADIAQDKRLCRALARHCAVEVPATVAMVTADPIQIPNLRACMPVVRVSHPSVAELSRTVAAQLRTLEKLLPGSLCADDHGKVEATSADTLAPLCGKALAGLPIQQALNLLTMQIEASSAGIGTERTITISPALLANAKADILNKEGYMTLIRELPDMSRIGGLENLKRWIGLRSRGFSPEAKESRLTPPKGVMLVGPPGTAKSMSAKAIANIFGVPLIRLDMGALFNSLIGSSERNLRNALQVADASAPCVLLVDEADKGLAGMTGGRSDGGVSTRLMGALLTWMAEKTTDVFVVFTANSIDGLPPEITRRGRLDGVFFVDLPNSKERQAIWKIHLALVGQSLSEGELYTIVEHSQGYSGAEIEAVVQDALYAVFDGKAATLSFDVLRTALKATVPLSKARAADLKDLRDWANQNAISASDRDENEEKVGEQPIGFVP